MPMKPVNLGRHKQSCTICAHPDKENIERDFLDWKSAIQIATDYSLASRQTVYFHAKAFGLYPKRDRNIRAALASFIERGSGVEVTAASYIAAVQAYAKINAAGQWVERSEHINLNELFDRMSRAELEKYAKDGELPDWFTQNVRTTTVLSQGEAGGQ
jgi:hypothetical protein